MDFLPYLPIAALGLSAYSAISSRVISKDSADRERRLAILEKQMGLFWSLVEKHMTTILHSPHTPDLDRLLERYQEGDDLTSEEVDELSHRLLTVINSPTEQQGSRAGAVFLLAALSVRYDLDFDPCIEGE